MAQCTETLEIRMIRRKVSQHCVKVDGVLSRLATGDGDAPDTSLFTLSFFLVKRCVRFIYRLDEELRYIGNR